MNISPFVEDLQNQLKVAAQAGGDQSRELAERLLAPLEASTRLVLLEALAAAASEITRELAPGGVDLRIRGRDPEFVVTMPATPAFAPVASAIPEPPAPSVEPAPGGDEGGMSRITLRLPDQLKVRVEQAAEREGHSVNSWLVRAVAAALEPKDRRSEKSDPSGGQRFTGWVR